MRICAYTYMTKIISLSDSAYKELKKIKENKSFSEIILLSISKVSNKNKILEFFGKGGIDAKKFKELRGLWVKWSEGKNKKNGKIYLFL